MSKPRLIDILDAIIPQSLIRLAALKHIDRTLNAAREAGGLGSWWWHELDGELKYGESRDRAAQRRRFYDAKERALK